MSGLDRGPGRRGAIRRSCSPDPAKTIIHSIPPSRVPGQAGNRGGKVADGLWYRDDISGFQTSRILTDGIERLSL